MDDGVRKEDKSKIIRILNALFLEVKIYLYGSRTRGTHREWSDIDLVLDIGQLIEGRYLEEARGIFRESSIMYKIQLVDLHKISEEFKKVIMEDMLLWKE